MVKIFLNQKKVMTHLHSHFLFDFFGLKKYGQF